MHYFLNTPWWLKKVYPECIWNIKTNKKELYLTFDDGPHPDATSFVLKQLKAYNAKATFFCIGKNVKEHFDIYKNIVAEEHSPGNHTYDHLNGWKTKDEIYLDNIFKAKLIIDSNLFRPPYGKISKFQLTQLKAVKYQLKTIMWSILSGDFDKNLPAEKCYSNVIKNAKQGSVIVFHDSEKCLEKIRYILPKVLEHFKNSGYEFKSIN